MMLQNLENVELTTIYQSLREWISYSGHDEDAKQFLLEVYYELTKRLNFN